MTNQQILTKAIEKAIAGGWNGLPSVAFKEGYGNGVFILGKELLTWRFELWHGTLTRGEYDDYEEVRIEAIIFNHNFAKALWGEEEKGKPRSDQSGGSFDRGGMMIFEQIYKHGWQHHLKEMVIADYPIAYLGQHI